MKVLNHVKKIRKERGLSLRDLERISGVGHSTISKVENGMVYPNQLTIIQISTALKMEAQELFIFKL
jgi:transcriptional regulator with XRE-family HTH domain